MCRKSATVEVPDAEFAAWQAGALIQHALTSVPTEQREQLVTGIDSKCWTKLFAQAEE